MILFPLQPRIYFSELYLKLLSYLVMSIISSSELLVKYVTLNCGFYVMEKLFFITL